MISTTSQLLCPSCRRKLRKPQLYPLHCVCGYVITDETSSVFVPMPTIHREGPGTELLAITNELGIEAKPNCSCKATAAKMDAWGIPGCEQNREWIVQQIEANAAKWSWLEKLQIAASNAVNPLALSLAFRGNIYHALLDESIQRYRRKNAANSSC